ncbi:hypothetical protein EG835_01630 [bacterium]|nr:hypothetical protein [bacterium]
MKRVLIGVLVVVVALGVAGCKSISEKIGEEVGEEIAGGIVGGDVEVDGDAVTIETDEGAVTMDSSEGEMPEDFPSEFPMYDGIEVDSTSSFASESDTTYYVNLLSEDDPKDVYEWYKSEFSAEGWAIEGDLFMSDDSGDSGMLTVKKDGMNGTLTVGSGSENTEVGIILLVEK